MSTPFSKIIRKKHSRKQSTACSPPLTTEKNGAGTGLIWSAMRKPTATNGTETSPWLGDTATMLYGLSMRTSPTTASCKNSWRGTSYPKRMQMRSPQPVFIVWVSGTTNQLTVNSPAMIIWTIFFEPRETYFWPCPLAAPGAMIIKSIRYPPKITIPCFLSSPTCLHMEKEIPI